jgi:hypothetical protein
MTTPTLEPVTFGERPLRIEDVLALANRQVPTQLQATPRSASASPRARSSSIPCWTRKA